MKNLIIIEGLWNVGKTSFIKKFCSKFLYEFIEEPNHQKEGIKNNISDWYKIQHKFRLENAIHKISENKKIIMERSILSNFAYSYALEGNYSESLLSNFYNQVSYYNYIIIYLTPESKSIDISKYIPKGIKPCIFKEKYSFFYKNILLEKKIDVVILESIFKSKYWYSENEFVKSIKYLIK